MLNTLIVKFKNPLQKRELPMFRGAVVSTMGNQCPLLFHNHQGDGLRYSYPLIQYKCLRGKAAIVCVGDGCEEIGAYFCNGDFHLRLGEERDEAFEIDAIHPHRTMVQVWNDTFNYHLRDWLPFNADNYHQYLQLQGVVERTQFLEKILVGNILSACKGLDVFIEGAISCKIVQFSDPKKSYHKGVPLMGFDLDFVTNISLPDYIGLGKGASLGHGVLNKKIYKNPNIETEK